MTNVIISGIIELLAVVGLVLTIVFRKRLETSLFLYLLAFEVIVIIANAWLFICYGAVVELGRDWPDMG